jgi:scyllo-inositol 2-dehydrogenase (NADP+)
MAKIRIGVVGAGLIWKRAHRPALQLFGDQAEVTAFSAASEKTRREVGQSYPGVPVYSDYRQLVASPDVDWVLVLTPIPLNAPVSKAALQAGKHVFVEKPMARTLAEGEELVRIADETGRHLYVLEQDVYLTYLHSAEEVIRSGEIGEVITYEIVAHELFDATPEHSAGGYGATQWRIHADFPLGPLFDGGHHPIARLSRLFGMPASIYASGRRTRPTYGEFGHVLMHCEHDSGVRGSFSHASVLSERRNHLYIWGTQGVLSVDRNQLVIDRNDGSQRTVPLPTQKSYEVMWQALFRAITEGRDPYYTRERAFQDLRILLAVQRSIQTDGKVRV